VETRKSQIRRARSKKDGEVIVKGTKEITKKNERWFKQCEQLKKKAVKALREWKRTKINRNSFVEEKVLDEKTALLFLNVEFGLGGCFPYN
jgi:nitroimidazol reductase NimA-like FMN-containing flavoprotein (pyridoxamine 5'-phosphate oxidase superfamily)